MTFHVYGNGRRCCFEKDSAVNLSMQVLLRWDYEERSLEPSWTESSTTTTIHQGELRGDIHMAVE